MSNPYCVPFALSKLANVSIDDAEKLLKDELGDIEIRGVYYPVILQILTQKFNLRYGTRYRIELGMNALICFRGHVGVWMNDKFFDTMNPHGINHFPPKMKIQNMFEVYENDK